MEEDGKRVERERAAPKGRRKRAERVKAREDSCERAAAEPGQDDIFLSSHYLILRLLLILRALPWLPPLECPIKR